MLCTAMKYIVLRETMLKTAGPLRSYVLIQIPAEVRENRVDGNTTVTTGGVGMGV